MTDFESMLKVMKLFSWKRLLVDQEQHLYKFSTSPTSYCLLLNDMKAFYFEYLSSSEVVCKFEELNPGMEMPLHRIISVLEKILSYSDEKEMPEIQSLIKNKNEILLRSKTAVAGLPFIWQFRLVECGNKMLKEQLLQPLVGMIAELQERQSFLISLIKKKDTEIEDYKKAGAKVSRKYLETPKFDEHQFLTDRSCPLVLSETIRNSMKTTFDQINEKFYVAVATAYTLIEEQQNKLLEDDKRAARNEPNEENTNFSNSPLKLEDIDEEKEIARRKELELKLLAKPAKKKKKIAF